MRSSMVSRVTIAANALAFILCAVLLFDAVHIRGAVRGRLPQLNSLGTKLPRPALREQNMTRAAEGDPFRVAQLQPPPPREQQVPQKTARPPVKLVGVVMLPTGGLALVESNGGSRVLRVGDDLSGQVLREVAPGEATFADSATGEMTVLRLRKEGS